MTQASAVPARQVRVEAIGASLELAAAGYLQLSVQRRGWLMDVVLVPAAAAELAEALDAVAGGAVRVDLAATGGAVDVGTGADRIDAVIGDDDVACGIGLSRDGALELSVALRRVLAFAAAPALAGAAA